MKTASVAFLLLMGSGDATPLTTLLSPPVSTENRLTITDQKGSLQMTLEVEEMSGDPGMGIRMVGVEGEILLEEGGVSIKAVGGWWHPQGQRVRLDRVEMASAWGWNIVAEEIWFSLEEESLSTEGSFALNYEGMLLTGQGLTVELATLSGRVETRGVLRTAPSPAS